MNDAKKEELLLEIAKKLPVLVCSLVEKTSSVGQGEGYHPPPDSNQPTWCTCRNCREMPKDEERKCCGFQPNDCLSKLPVSTLKYIIVTLTSFSYIQKIILRN